jgi:hypothetical protein
MLSFTPLVARLGLLLTLLLAMGTTLIASPAFAESQSDCVAGTYFDGDETCVPAPAGSYVDTAGAASATLSPAGSFVAASGATEATLCVAGTYQPDTGATVCLTAPAGSFAAEGATAATLCAAGTYQPEAGATSCISVAAGSFSAAGASSTTACAAGTFQSQTGQASCTQAPAGSFVAGTGKTVSVLCAAGTYQPAAGQASCVNAPAGSFVASTGALSATQCKAGTYQNSTGGTSCINAGAGYYVAKAGATSRTACATATGTTATSCAAAVAPEETVEESLPVETDGADPAPLDAGAPNEATGLQCVPGTWSETGLSTAEGGCIEAEPGYAVVLAGATEQTECPAGTLTQENGAASCRPAPVGTFVPTAGSSKAYVCEEATGLGATTCAGYVAPAVIAFWVVFGVLVLGGGGTALWWYLRKNKPGPSRTSQAAAPEV